MKLIEMSQTEFLDVLSSNEPAPGGGSVAALEGALGTALIHMVSALTVGKEKYVEHQNLMAYTMAETETLRHQMTDVIDRDTKAFHQVSAVFSMPKNTDEEKEARKSAMQKALKACTLTPFEVMELSLAALKYAYDILYSFNTNAASDLGVAALSLKAAVQSAWLNVLINVGGIRDEQFVRDYKDGGQRILDEALPLADKIYKHVLESLS